MRHSVITQSLSSQKSYGRGARKAKFPYCGRLPEKSPVSSVLSIFAVCPSLWKIKTPRLGSGSFLLRRGLLFAFVFLLAAFHSKFGFAGGRGDAFCTRDSRAFFFHFR